MEDQRGLSQILCQALPSQHDADILISTGRTFVFLQAACNPFNDVFWPGTPQHSSVISMLPSANAHPILFARILMRLSLSLQQLDRAFDFGMLDLTGSPHEIREKYFGLASDMVLSNDELVQSLEGFECLMLQGIYLINSGALRRALLHFRRCHTLAQFVGVDGPNSRPPPAVDPNTRVSYASIWYRVVYAERFLSLLLGVP